MENTCITYVGRITCAISLDACDGKADNDNLIEI